MASLTIDLPQKINSIDEKELKKLNSYLYQLSEEIKYMFNNISPENYSNEAFVAYQQEKDKVASMEVSLEKIEADYVTATTFASLKLDVDGIKQTYVNKTTFAELKLAVDGISATYVKDGEVVAALNLETQGVAIAGHKIVLNGAITNGNGTFSIDANGNMQATGGTFSGDITGASGTFGGKVRGGSLELGGSDSAPLFKVDKNGNLWIGGTGNAAPFRVTNGGAVTATNLALNGGSISIGSTTEGGQTVPMFSVDPNGNMYARSGTFAGTVRGGQIAIGGTAASPNFWVNNQGHASCKYLEIDGTTNTGSIGCGVFSCQHIEVSSGDYGYGNVEVEGEVSCSYLSVTNPPWYNDYSDERLKKDIEKIDGKEAVALVKELDPKMFTFIKDERRATGFIAQEILEAQKKTGTEKYPIVVTKDDGYLAMSYQNLIALIVAAMQEMTKEAA